MLNRFLHAVARMSYVVRHLNYVRGGLILLIRGQAERIEYAIGIQESTCNR
jgi:hypothetical protein